MKQKTDRMMLPTCKSTTRPRRSQSPGTHTALTELTMALRGTGEGSDQALRPLQRWCGGGGLGMGMAWRYTIM